MPEWIINFDEEVGCVRSLTASTQTRNPDWLSDALSAPLLHHLVKGQIVLHEFGYTKMPRQSAFSASLNVVSRECVCMYQGWV